MRVCGRLVSFFAFKTRERGGGGGEERALHGNQKDGLRGEGVREGVSKQRA